MIFKGVWSSEEEIPQIGNKHDQEARLEAVFEGTKKALKDADDFRKENKGFSFVNYRGEKDEIYATSVKILSNLLERPISIIDLGGAMGLHFINLYANSLEHRIDKYIIFESEASCKKAKLIYDNFAQIRFMHGFPREIQPFAVDFLYSNCALPYIGNWKNSMEEILKYEPKIILLERLYMGDFPTFFTAQYNIKGTVMAAQFINKNEFINFIEDKGYVMEAYLINEIPFKTTELPIENRITSLKSILFIRSDIIKEYER